VYLSRSSLGGVVGPVLVAAVIAACGSSYNGEDSATLPSRDGGTGDEATDGQTLHDGAPGIDAAPPTDASSAPCDLTKDFGTPVPITELNSMDIEGVSSVSADELTIYLGSNHGVAQGYQQFVATRATKAATWGPLQAALPAGAWDNWGMSVTADGLTAVVSSDRNGSNSELYVTTRVSTLAAFNPNLGLISGATNSSANEEGPRWSADGKTLYFDSTRGGSRDLYRVPLVGAAFGAPVALTELNSPALEAVPVVSADELTIYFLSTRAPTPDGDIYVATRADKSALFGNVKPLPGVNSPTAIDAPGQLSGDGCTLYMSSDRAGGAGKNDVFVARRPK
jgi:hypothetical protein